MAKICILSKADTANIESAINAFSAAREDLANLVEEIIGDWEWACADKFERWQESEAGQEAHARIETFRTWIDETVPEEPSVPPLELWP